MVKKTDKLQLIDKLRDGAGSLEISTPDDDSAISEIISTGGRLLAVKGKGIYEIKLADQVDPDRTNISVPNTFQQVIPYGINAGWVGAVILTAHNLFNSSCSPSEVDGTAAFDLVLYMAEDIAGAYQIEENYRNTEQAAMRKLDPKIRADRSFVMPAHGNVESRCNEFLQRADHALSKLFRLVQMFYTDVDSGGWESLQSIIDNEPQKIDNFPQFLAEVIPFLQLIRNSRNCVEHPRAEQKLVVSDFSLDPDNVMNPPMIEIMHPRTSQEKMPVSEFFKRSLDQIVGIAELMMVFLCKRHVKSFAGMPVLVIELPPNRRRSANVRYTYGTMMGDQFVPIG
jgi:hypothetical protein